MTVPSAKYHCAGRHRRCVSVNAPIAILSKMARTADTAGRGKRRRAGEHRSQAPSHADAQAAPTSAPAESAAAEPVDVPAGRRASTDGA